jgi:hypothetical protein
MSNFVAFIMQSRHNRPRRSGIPDDAPRGFQQPRASVGSFAPQRCDRQIIPSAVEPSSAPSSPPSVHSPNIPEAETWSEAVENLRRADFIAPSNVDWAPEQFSGPIDWSAYLGGSSHAPTGDDHMDLADAFFGRPGTTVHDSGHLAASGGPLVPFNWEDSAHWAGNEEAAQPTGSSL